MISLPTARVCGLGESGSGSSSSSSSSECVVLSWLCRRQWQCSMASEPFTAAARIFSSSRRLLLPLCVMAAERSSEAACLEMASWLAVGLNDRCRYKRGSSSSSNGVEWGPAAASSQQRAPSPHSTTRCSPLPPSLPPTLAAHCSGPRSAQTNQLTSITIPSST